MIKFEINLLFCHKVGSAQVYEISFSFCGEMNCHCVGIKDDQVEMSLLSLAFLLCTDVLLPSRFTVSNKGTIKAFCLFSF